MNVDHVESEISRQINLCTARVFRILDGYMFDSDMNKVKFAIFIHLNSVKNSVKTWGEDSANIEKKITESAEKAFQACPVGWVPDKTKSAVQKIIHDHMMGIYIVKRNQQY